MVEFDGNYACSTMRVYVSTHNCLAARERAIPRAAQLTRLGSFLWSAQEDTWSHRQRLTKFSGLGRAEAPSPLGSRFRFGHERVFDDVPGAFGAVEDGRTEF